MPEIARPDGARIHYRVYGRGFPVLLLAPGGVSSQVESWEDNFFDPISELAQRFKVIAMDQRNAGRSPAPAVPFSYDQAVGDQLAVLDELGLRQAHVYAAGIGCAHAWRLVHDAPEHVRSVVCQEPVGLDESNTLGDFYGMFDEAMRLPRAATFDDPESEGMAAVIAAAERDGRMSRNPSAGPFGQRLRDDVPFRDDILALRREKYITLLVRVRDGYWPPGSAYFTVPEDWMTGFPAPMLVLPGKDRIHPPGLAKRLGAEVPDVRVLEAGFDSEIQRASTTAAVVEFLLKHTPH